MSGCFLDSKSAREIARISGKIDIIFNTKLKQYFFMSGCGFIDKYIILSNPSDWPEVTIHFSNPSPGDESFDTMLNHSVFGFTEINPYTTYIEAQRQEGQDHIRLHQQPVGTDGDFLLLELLVCPHFYKLKPGPVLQLLYLEMEDSSIPSYNAVCSEYFAPNDTKLALEAFEKRFSSPDGAYGVTGMGSDLETILGKK